MLKNKFIKIALVIVTLTILSVSLAACTAGARPLGWSGVAVYDDVAYYATTDGYIVARNVSNGQIVFSESIKEKAADGAACSAPTSSISVYGTPVLINDVLYITSYTGEVFAFNSSGSRLWHKDDFGKIVARVTAVDDNIVIADADGNVTALSQNNGSVVWTYKGSNTIWASPILVNDNLYFGDLKNNYYCINAENGTEIWKYQGSRGAFYSEAVAVQSGDQTLIVVGNFDRSVYAFDAANGSLVWNTTKLAKNWFWATPVVMNNKIYAASLDGQIYVLSSDGRIDSIIELSDKKQKIVSTPVVVADLLFIATQNGKLYSVDEDGKVSNVASDLDQVVNAPLTTDGNLVFVHTQKEEKVYAIDPISGKTDWSKPGRDI